MDQNNQSTMTAAKVESGSQKMSSLPRLLFVGADKIVRDFVEVIAKAKPNAIHQVMTLALTKSEFENTNGKLNCQVDRLENFRKIFAEFKPEIVLLCCTPQFLISSGSIRGLVCQLLQSVPKTCIIISMLTEIKSIARLFKHIDRNLVSLIVERVGEPDVYSILYHSHINIEADHLRMINELFELIGNPVIRLADESELKTVANVCSSSLAFFYEANQAMIDISVKNGLTKEQATRICAHMSKFAGETLLAKRDSHPYLLRDNIQSPAGPVSHGLNKWHEQSINHGIGLAMQASINRYKELPSSNDTRPKLMDVFNNYVSYYQG